MSSTNEINFSLNINGNAYKGMLQLDGAVENVLNNIQKTSNWFDKLGNSALKLDAITDVLGKMSSAFRDIQAPGIALNTSLQDLSAITGVTGKGLKEIEGYARQTAKTFGVDAAQSVESYKLILSQLSPEIAKTPEALKSMGESIATLSKTMGGDTTAAAEVLTTAMNQFQVSTVNPIAASREMSIMMNVMAAAAKEGSAELPQIKEALEQAGMSAKAANVSFAETNAAIQVLDKAGKKGSEGGVALRNVMNILSRGRFMDKETLKALQQAGVDIEILSNKSLSLTDRLRPLQAVMGDTALIGKMFGMENQAAAIALLSGLDTVDDYTEAISGTKTAYEQAETVMESYAEKQARIKAQFDDIKISILNATGDLGIWVQTLADAAIPLAQLSPLLIGVGKAIEKNKSKWTSFTKAVKVGIVKVGLDLGTLKFSIASAGGMFKMLEGVAKTSCRGIGVAIMKIPIVGLIAAAISAIIGVVTLLWKKSEGFRRLVFGVWESIKAIFSNVWTVVTTIFGGIWGVVKSLGQSIANFFTGLWDSIVGFVSGLWDSIVSTFSKVINWIVQKLGVIGSWIKENLVQPIKDAFAGIWDFIKGIFDKILNGLGKLFEPIRTLWNKIFPDDKFRDIGDAYAKGAVKGSESWRKDHQENVEPNADTSVLGSDNKSDHKVTITGGDLTGGNIGSNAGESSGKAQQINITVKSMVETMNFNGGMRENAADVENQLREMMARILGMAATAS